MPSMASEVEWSGVETERMLAVPATERAASAPGGRIEVLLLDVGGVLAPPPDAASVAVLERELGLATGGLQVLLHQCEPWYALSTGTLDEEGYWRGIARQTGSDPAALQQLLQPVWEPALARLDEGVVALVRAVGMRARVAILSNHTLRLEERLRSHGVDTLFHPIINSARVGLRKPDPRVFLHAIELLRVAPGAILFVDDKPANVQAAERLGLRGICFEDATTLGAELIRYGVLPQGIEA